MTDVQHARLLLAVLRGEWDAFDRLADHREPDAATFLELCRQADVAPWVHARVGEAGRLQRLGAATAEGLATIRRKIRHDNLLLISQAERALQLLLDAGVVPVVLKGLDLLHRTYERFDERTLDDVDLLVARDDLRPALEALEAGGWQVPPEPRRTHYIRSSHHLGLRSPGPVTVDFELHWNLAQEVRFRVDVDGLFERSCEIDIGGRVVRRMDDHDLVAHLLLHHFTHYFDRRLKWVIDMHALASLPGFDWQRVVRRVEEWNAGIVCGFSLLHLHKLFPRWVPDDLCAALPVPGWRRLLTRPLVSDHPLDLFRGTRNRRTQLYLAAVMLEQPWLLPLWLMHRSRRDGRPSTNPLDRPDVRRAGGSGTSVAGPPDGTAD